MIRTSTYEEELNKNGSFTYACVGVSMLPMLRQRKDLFTITKRQGRCKKYDVVLYKRYPNDYVLHRIVEVREKDYVILGDNCLHKEYGIRDEDIIGVLTSFVRDGKEYQTTYKPYQIYAKIWYLFYPLRRLWMKTKHIGRKFLKKGQRDGR